MRIVRFGAAVVLSTSLFFAGCAPKSPPPISPATDALAAVTTTAAAPAAQAIARIEVTGDSTPSLVRVDKDQEITVRVRVHGMPLMTKKRPPIDLALVFDSSGSMEGQPIDDARAACAKLIDLLSDGDSIAIVTFGSRAKVIVPAVRIGKESRETAKLALRNIKAEGTTDMAGGLTEGLAQIRAHVATPEMANAIHRVVLVGDGVPNDAPAVLALADNARAEHVPVTVLGLGNDFDETLMTSLAQRSSGTFHFVDEASRVGVVFHEQISRMERLVARGARIELTPGPGVTITEIVGLPSSPSGHIRVAPLGDLAEGQTRDVFVRVTAKGRHDGKSMELLDAQVSYTLPEGSAGSAELSSSVFLKAAASSDAARLKDATVIDIEHGVTTVRVADGIVKAIALARDGELTDARKVLDTSLRLAKEGEKKFSDKALGDKVIEMTKLRKSLASLAPPPDDESKSDSPMKSSVGSVPKSRPSPSPPPQASPAEAMQLRAAHGDAMKALQGDD